MTPILPTTPPHVSVNHIQIVDLPGLPIDDEVRGQRAYHLLSSRAVIRPRRRAQHGGDARRRRRGDWLSPQPVRRACRWLLH